MICRTLSIFVALATAASCSALTANWMGLVKPFVSHLTLLDLSLPGTHDTMTCDLSTTVSDGANDLPPTISWILHNFHDVADLGAFVREQAHTQPLSLTEQLDAGIRFIDFRVMYSAPPNRSSTAPYDWYCLHLVQSNQPAMTYLEEARRWMAAHPDEVVVFWISRHGNPCGNEFPDVTVAEQRRFWGRVTALFGDLVFAGGNANTTTLGEMYRRGQRAVFYVSSYHNVTGGSPLATDACQIDNRLGDAVTDAPRTRAMMERRIDAAPQRRAADKRENRFYLQSMAGGPSNSQVLDTLMLQYLGANAKVSERCAKSFSIPNMTAWCPPSLLAVSQLTNYYNQYFFEYALRRNATAALPNAIYIDGVGQDGTIRTGTALKGPTTGYAYVAAIAAMNLLRSGDCRAPACAAVLDKFLAARAAHPYRLWNDPVHGRLPDWPPMA